MFCQRQHTPHHGHARGGRAEPPPALGRRTGEKRRDVSLSFARSFVRLFFFFIQGIAWNCTASVACLPEDIGFKLSCMTVRADVVASDPELLPSHPVIDKSPKD